jgi:hypothetical protein
MNCIKAQSMITPFINNQLNLKDTEEFVNHISSCKECKEELEVYYALLTAMRQLDEDKNLTSDFNLELNEKLEQARDKVIHARFTYYRKKVILLLTIIILAFFISIRYAGEREEYIHPVTDSDFRIRAPFKNGRSSLNERLLQEYLTEQGITPLPPKPTLFP